jgi:hypothetical protein
MDVGHVGTSSIKGLAIENTQNIDREKLKTSKKLCY